MSAIEQFALIDSLTQAPTARTSEVLTMSPVEWLLIELIVAPLVGGAMAYGIVLWIGQPKGSLATPDAAAAREGSNSAR